MSITFTFHGTRRRDAEVALVDVLPGQIGDAVTIAIAATSAAVTATGLYRLTAAADCNVRIGAAGDDVSKGEPWIAGSAEPRFITAGQVVKVGAPS